MKIKVGGAKRTPRTQAGIGGKKKPKFVGAKPLPVRRKKKAY